jgi:tetratricopeptide (TPR) repeat protein
VANEAFADLAAWQTKAARRTLEKEAASFEGEPEFQAAWALLQIQEGAGKDQDAANAALQQLQQATQKGRTADPAALYFQGEALYQQQRIDEASTAWKLARTRAGEMVQANPDDPAAQFYLGASLVRQRQFEQAIEALRRAKELGFDPAMVQHQIGLVHLFNQDWQAAKEAFDAGLESDPRYAPMYYWRAMAWEKLGRKDNMLIDLDQYVKLAPDGPEAAKANAVLKSAGG